MTKTIQNQINSNVEYAIKATENSFRSKYFVVTRGEHIQSFHKTKRGAEGYVKKSSFSYYDDYLQEMKEGGTNLEIVELSSFDIIDYYNEPTIWFSTMLNRWKMNQHNDYLLIQATNLECSENVITAIQLILENTVDGKSFPSCEMVGLSDNEVIETIEETQEEVIEVAVVSPEVTEEISEVESTNTVTMKLNDEKSGVELYFTDKPSEEVRAELKSNGFRWSRFNKCWYAKQQENTLALAEKLTNRKVDTVEESAVAEALQIELVEFVEVTTFTISEETEKRLIDNSMFNTDRKVGRETVELQSTLSNILELTQEAISFTDSDYNKNKLINGFNSFCERYTRELGSYLYQRSINPSWAVTGRGNMNVAKYNKKQDQLQNKMLTVVEMLEKQRSVISKYKKRFKKEAENKSIQAIEEAMNNLDSDSISFTTRNREIEYYGYNYNTRSYESPKYFFMKMAGCYRIFESNTGKEVHSMKTADKLTDTKKYVLYLESENK